MGNYSTAVTELLKRIAFHTQPGGILQGMKHNDVPVADIKGLVDFPCVSQFIPAIKETHIGSALRSPGAGLKTVVGGVITCPMVVSVARATQKSSDQPLVTLLEWCEKVLDAIETRTTDLKVDSNLSGSGRILDAQITNNFALDLSLNAGITIIIEVNHVYRGERRT